jgi:hypothetical protein
LFEVVEDCAPIPPAPLTLADALAQVVNVTAMFWIRMHTLW